MSSIVFYKNKFMPYKEAKLPLLTHALHYGTGVFEGIRGYYNKEQKALFVFRMKEHYERLLNSCKVLMITPGYNVDQLCALTIKLLEKNKFKQDVYIRPLAFKGAEKILTFDLPNIEDSLVILALPMGHYLNVSQGIKTAVSSWRRVDDNSLPARAKITGAYVNTALAKQEAAANGFGEAIFLTHEGHVSEGSAENIFIVKNREIATPPPSDNILEGITRNTIMEILEKEFEMPVLQRSIDRSELYSAEEIFMTGTGAEITPVVEVDRRTVGSGKPGKLTIKLQNIYFDIVRGKNKKYSRWLTKIS